MRSRNSFPLTLLLIALAAPLGCGPKDTDDIMTPEPAPAEPTRPAPTPARDTGEEVEGSPWDSTGVREDPVEQQRIPPRGSFPSDRLGTVFFAYDSFELTPVSLRTLRENAEAMKAYANESFVIEGHCDERGTIEYNLALGEKRAAAVRDYLVSLGVDRPRLRIVTYGEERPVDPGHSESAWSKNRRAAFLVDR